MHLQLGGKQAAVGAQLSIVYTSPHSPPPLLLTSSPIQTQPIQLDSEGNCWVCCMRTCAPGRVDIVHQTVLRLLYRAWY